MADVQPENGYARVANELLQAFATTRLTSVQYAILMSLIRTTFGDRGRKTCRTNYSRLARATCCDRKAVRHAFMDLQSRQIVSAERSGNRIIAGIQKDYDRWLPAAKAKPCCPQQTPNWGVSPHPQSGAFHPTPKVGRFTPLSGASHPTIKEKGKEKDSINILNQADSTQALTKRPANRDDDDGRSHIDQSAQPPPTNPNNPTNTEEVTMRDFDALWAACPKRTGPHNRVRSQRAYESALMRGVSHHTMLSGWVAYGAWAKATGKEGTQYCKSLARFIEQQQWHEDWSVREITDPARISVDQANHSKPATKPDNWTEQEWQMFGFAGTTEELNARTGNRLLQIIADGKAQRQQQAQQQPATQAAAKTVP